MFDSLGKGWEYLNGKKTAIAFGLCAGADLMSLVLVGTWHLDEKVVQLPQVIETCNVVGWSLGGIGLGHKIAKGRTTVATGPEGGK
jgi:hypothetical protein